MKRVNKAVIAAKNAANWCCQKCGSTQFIQAHHRIAGDDNSLIILCGECHSKEHQNIPKDFFLTKHIQPYWHNKSASSIARDMGVHYATIIRRAKKLHIPPGYINTKQLELLEYPKIKLPQIPGFKIIRPYHRDNGGYPVLHIPSRLARECGIIPGNKITFIACVKDGRLIIEQIKEEK